MPFSDKKKLKRATIVYWILLVYIVAALFWWFILLEKQSLAMTRLKIEQLNLTVDSVSNAAIYKNRLLQIQNEQKRSRVKHISEGITFSLFIITGAVFVYRSFRREINLHMQQQNFMMAVTHEFKTPISIAKLNLETLQKHKLTPEKQSKLIGMTLQETARLNTLTNNILVSSQLDSDVFKPTHEELNFSDLVKDRMLDFRNRYAERNFEEKIDPDIEINGDPFLLQMLINNLLENAIKYSPKEKTVGCVLKKENHRIVLSITDEGAGIPDDEKKNIFKIFYRLSNESIRKTQGTGLGLYLCQRIAMHHKAKIIVADHKPNGSNFTVIF